MRTVVGRLRWMLALGMGLSAIASIHAQSLTWIGGDGLSSGLAYAVSADGRTVVGQVRVNSIARDRAFRWHNGALQIIQMPVMFDGNSSARGVSADGSVVVGFWSPRLTDSEQGFVWTPQTGAQSLGSPSRAFGVSADGRVVVGERSGAARWVDGTVQVLSARTARAASFDGAVVVGILAPVSNQLRAFRWTAQTGVQNLGTLPGGGNSLALAVSWDGATVVGRAFNAQNQLRAFRWTAQTGMQELDTLGGDSTAWGVSADGSIVVGESQRTDLQSYRACRWTPEAGVQDLNEVYAALLSEGSFLLTAQAVSPDGRYIVGSGYNAAAERYEAFLLDTWRFGDTNGDGCIDDSDLLNVLFAFGTPGTGYTRHEDINKDGVVDDADLLSVLFEFGGGC